MDKQTKFWVFRGGRSQDYELLVYEDHRIVVPRCGQHALLQAAHAAAHQRLGSTRSLLEKSFYWPNMQHDAYHYVQACRAVHKKRITPHEQQRPAITPDAQPEQVANEPSQDQTNADPAYNTQPGESAKAHLGGEVASLP